MVHLRRATEADARTIWGWRNEEEARRQSFHSDFIPWPSHRDWFVRMVRDERETFLIGVKEDSRPVGYTRLSIDGTGAEVSIVVNRDDRGRGLGGGLLRETVRWAAQNLSVDKLTARVKAANARSLALFERSGFCHAAPLTDPSDGLSLEIDLRNQRVQHAASQGEDIPVR